MAYKFFVLGDQHLKNQDHLGVITKQGVNSRLLDKIAVLDSFIKQAILEKATDIVLLGDIFHGFSPDERVRKIFWKTMASAIKSGIHIYIMRGNHDTYGETANLDAEEPILASTVKILPNDLYTEVFDKAKIGQNTLKIAFIPYKDDAEIIKNYAEKCKDCHIVFGHIEIAGATLGADNHQMRSEVPKTLFNTQLLVWLGHIHKHQEIEANRFAYLGSTTKCDFAEREDRKVYGIIDISNNGEIKTEFRDIPQRPMIQVDVLEEDVTNLYNAKEIPDSINISGALLKLMLIGSSSWMKTINRVKFKKRFTKVLKVSFGDKKTDTVEQTVIGTNSSLMEDRVKVFNESRSKGPEYLKVGLELTSLTRQSI